jgi:hypothetical protein
MPRLLGCLGGLAVLVTALVLTSNARPASAAPLYSEGPLLVVVETGPGAECDAAAVRAAIAAELHKEVVAPSTTRATAAAAGAQPDMIVVAIDKDRIVLTLRGSAEKDLTRAIAAPSDRAAKLRAVAWLAGNLARDQISPLLAADDSGPPAMAPPATAPPASESLPAAGPPPVEDDDAPGVTRSRPAPLPGAAHWSITLGAGPARTFESPFGSGYAISPPRWNPMLQLEATRHAASGFFVGMAADVGPWPVHPFGAAALGGLAWRGPQLFVEISAGAGAQAFRPYSLPPGGHGPSPEPLGARMFFRGAVNLGHPLTSRFDLVAHLGGHVTAAETNSAAFLNTTLGLRVRL